MSKAPADAADFPVRGENLTKAGRNNRHLLRTDRAIVQGRPADENVRKVRRIFPNNKIKE
jgi:hypothetical protein